MKTLDRMIIRQFLPTLVFAVMFFVLILEMVDLFANLWRYISNGVDVADMLTVSIYYLPKCIVFSLPIAVLFAVSYTLGNYYSNNELIAVFGAGVSLFRFVRPLILIGLLISAGAFVFEEAVVIDTFAKKNELGNRLLQNSVSMNNSNPTVIDHNGLVVYNADFYNDKDVTLSNLTVVKRDGSGRLAETVSAEWASWNNEEAVWVLNRCRSFVRDEKDGTLKMEYLERLTDPMINADPFTFRKNVKDVDEMKVGDARKWIISLRRAGLPYREAMTKYYKRFSFALTPFIVSLLSSAVGGRFRKNILLMSLLTSLVISVVYYVLQMVLAILANLGYISPAAGAWTPFFVFCIMGFFAYSWANS